MNIALKEELKGNYVLAANLYENLYYSDSDMAEYDYANYAFLYWQFSNDYEFSRLHKLSKELIEKAGNNYIKILIQGQKYYPESLELKFWTKYYPHRTFYEEFTQKECEAMIEKHVESKNIIPFFYLYLFDQRKYEFKRNELLKLCYRIPNAKFNYIKSILESNAI